MRSNSGNTKYFIPFILLSLILIPLFLPVPQFTLFTLSVWYWWSPVWCCRQNRISSVMPTQCRRWVLLKSLRSEFCQLWKSPRYIYIYFSWVSRQKATKRQVVFPYSRPWRISVHMYTINEISELFCVHADGEQKRQQWKSEHCCRQQWQN